MPGHSYLPSGGRPIPVLCGVIAVFQGLQSDVCTYLLFNPLEKENAHTLVLCAPLLSSWLSNDFPI